MPNKYSRFIPVAVLAVLLIALALAFGPRFYRELLLSRRCDAMLRSAKSGNVSAMLAYLDPAQQQSASDLFAQYLPAGYEDHIASLKLSSIEMSSPSEAWTFVTCRTEGDGYGGLYQGKLRWHLAAGQWVWDFDGSYGSAYSPSVPPEWQSLSGYIALAGQW